MIYEMVLRAVTDLRKHWTDLRSSLFALHDALPITENIARNQIETVIGFPGVGLTPPSGISAIIEDIPEDPREDARFAFAEANPLLNSVRDLFITSLNHLSTAVEPILTPLLPTLLVSPTASVAAAATTVQSQLGELRRFIERTLEEVEEIRTPEGGRSTLTDIRGSVDTISTYPVLTQETGSGAIPSGPAATAAPSYTSLGQIVESTLRDVLGWRPKVSDSKGFVAALSQAFTCKEVSGRTECTYTPRTYAVQVQADLGAITGAQQSLYARAKAAYDQASILLERIRALDPAADPEEFAAFKAIVRSEITELVNELGVEGGPRVRRVDTYFDSLLGLNQTLTDAEQVQGRSRRLREVGGLTRDNVNTIDEEQVLSDYLTLVDYVISLRLSWNAQRRFFDRTGGVQPFLGTQLVLVSRALAVIAESVQEVYFTLDSVFLGSAERQTIELIYAGAPSIFLGELLEWVDRFASEEGRALIQDAGKEGVRALFPTLDTLTGLVRGALIPPQDPNRIPEGYRTSRVQRALVELAQYLDEAASLARPFLS